MRLFQFSAEEHEELFLASQRYKDIIIFASFELPTLSQNYSSRKLNTELKLQS